MQARENSSSLGRSKGSQPLQNSGKFTNRAGADSRNHTGSGAKSNMKSTASIYSGAKHANASPKKQKTQDKTDWDAEKKVTSIIGRQST